MLCASPVVICIGGWPTAPGGGADGVRPLLAVPCTRVCIDVCMYRCVYVQGLRCDSHGGTASEAGLSLTLPGVADFSASLKTYGALSHTKLS